MVADDIKNVRVCVCVCNIFGPPNIGRKECHIKYIPIEYTVVIALLPRFCHSERKNSIMQYNYVIRPNELCR